MQGPLSPSRRTTPGGGASSLVTPYGGHPVDLHAQYGYAVAADTSCSPTDPNSSASVHQQIVDTMMEMADVSSRNFSRMSSMPNMTHSAMTHSSAQPDLSRMNTADTVYMGGLGMGLGGMQRINTRAGQQPTPITPMYRMQSHGQGHGQGQPAVPPPIKTVLGAMSPSFVATSHTAAFPKSPTSAISMQQDGVQIVFADESVTAASSTRQHESRDLEEICADVLDGDDEGFEVITEE